MKTNELQLKDWILQNGYPSRVVLLINNYIETEIMADDREPCTFEPVPLTAEILEKNGFEVEEEVEDVGMGLCNCYSINNDSVVIFWADSYNTMTSAGTEDFMEEQWRMEVLGQGGSFKKYANMLYVHELQHALRLCGLNDLADNFKV